MLKFLKALTAKYWWVAIPVSAFSFLSLCLETLGMFGLDTRQWLDIVHALVIRYDYWLAHAFQFADAFIPFEVSVTSFERNLFVIMGVFVVPVVFKQLTSSNLKYFRSRENIYKILNSIFKFFIFSNFLLCIFYIIALLSDATNYTLRTDRNSIDVYFMIIFIFLSIYVTFIFRRKFFYALLFVITLLLSVELFRFVPQIQPQVDAFQERLEAVPIDLEMEAPIRR